MEATLETISRESSIRVDENKLLEKEWIEVNGLGGYSSNNLLNCNARKYHGLLIVPAPRIAERQMLISKFDEVIMLGEHKYFLAHHYYDPGVKIPLQENEKMEFYFSFDLNPKWVYHFPNFKITKEILMPWGENTTLIRYQVEGNPSESLKLCLRPLLGFRNFHAASRENPNANLNAEIKDDFVKFALYKDSPELFIQSNTFYQFAEEHLWYKNFHLKAEKERGYDYLEDLASTGLFEINLKNSRDFIISLSTKKQDLNKLNSIWDSEISRREGVERNTLSSSIGDLAVTLLGLEKNDFDKKLKNAALKFLVKPDDKSFSVIAGYHWFGEWGRDAMISLPGLLMNTGYEKAYLHTLRRFLDYKKDGLIPNIIGNDKESSAYNSVDGSLWLFWTIQEFLKLNNDYNLIKDIFWNDLKDIFTCYAASIPRTVKFNEEKGLIESGTETDSMSWMDACVNGRSVIPRHGFLVEINALWYNAVCFIVELAEKFKDPIAPRASSVKERIEKSFIPTFYMPELGYLADYVQGANPCEQLRPNQLFAISLPYSLIPEAIAQEMINVVENELLTPYGLRTLAPSDPGFCPKYQGNQEERDRAYHNGTVWPWLLGTYGEALLKVSINKIEAKSKIRSLIKNFESHFRDIGIGSISEIFDATEPYIACGCIAQAWSVAEIRRLTYLIK